MTLLVDIGIAAAVVAGFTVAVLAVGSRLASKDAATGFWDCLQRIRLVVDERVAAWVLGGCVAIMVGLGTLVGIADVPLEPFRLNAEQTVPTTFSSLLLVAAGALALLTARQRWGSPAWAWSVLGFGLIALGIDEIAEIHERVEVRTDLPTVIILAPLGLAMLVAWLASLPVLRERPPAIAFFVAAGAFGIASQAVDPIHNEWKSVAEEGFELASGALFLLAMLAVTRPFGPRPETASRPPASDQGSGGS